MADPIANVTGAAQQASRESTLSSQMSATEQLMQAPNLSADDLAQLRAAQANFIDNIKSLNPALLRVTEKIVEQQSVHKALLKTYAELGSKNTSRAKQLRMEIAVQGQLLLGNKKLVAGYAAEKTRLEELNKAITSLTSKDSVKNVEEMAKAKEAERAADREAERAKKTAPTMGQRKFVEGSKTLGGGISGVVGKEISKSLGSLKASNIGGLGKSLGGFYMVAQALAEVFSRATKNTADFATTFGAHGMYMAEQSKATRSALGGTMGLNAALLSSSDRTTTMSRVLASGALGAYQAQVLYGASTKDMADVLGSLVPNIVFTGKAMGMTADQSSELFASLHNTMGAFGGITKAKPELFTSRFTDVMGRFNQMQAQTGLGMTRLFGIMSEVSAVTLPLGHSFGAVSAQVSGTISALNELVSVSDGSVKAYLNNADAMKNFNMTLFQMGKAIAPAQVMGYRMMLGRAGGGDFFKQFRESATMTPYQNLEHEISTLRATFAKTPDQMFTALVAGGKATPEVANMLTRMMGAPGGGFDRMLAQLRTVTSDADIKKLAAAPGGEEWAKLGKLMTLREDPMQRLVTIAENLLDVVSGLAGELMTMAKSPTMAMAGHFVKRVGKLGTILTGN